ncbi:hypothetical protein QBC33DRAFT_456464 [Phialemonium atrogriseum]|uniref:SET domain-containing protein n=1 Tax=Phialemonium atrogriseum TaxID=1093897 RepID=A0AAJ0FEW9_9PEZI|nr:uncharacterized protein QBC33DRAFT_456464 [Phialemonium atrogriseum]KAK1764832.1 hypothetical protein QBC33DRAFT_456464 [Phialemonium atrogriseum]
MHTNRTQPPDARPGNQRSPSSLKRSPKGATPMKSSAQHDRTPSKSARFTRPPVREDHSSGGTVPNAALQTSAHPSKGYQTPKTLTPKKMDWTVDKIASQLATFASQVDKVHARLVHYTLQETFKRAPRPRHLSSIDDFADMPSTAVESEKSNGSTMAVKFKQHNPGRDHSKARRLHFPVVCIKSDKERVPKYRFHHMEIAKNILTPNTMLKFVPHLRDLDEKEEKRYFVWLNELESMDNKSGFKTLNRVQKILKSRHDEYAATLYMYLERWIKMLGIDGCSKSNLIRYMASQSENDDAITPQQKHNLLDSYSEDVGTPQTRGAAKLFTMAFDQVFGNRVTLRDILMLDESVETIVDNKRVKDTPSSQRARDEELLLSVEKWLGTYSILGCLICYSHDCEHGEYDVENQKRTFSVESLGRLGPLLKKKWVQQAREQTQSNSSPSKQAGQQLCKNQCFRSYDVGNPAAPVVPWSDNETEVLKAMFAILGNSSMKHECATACILGRKCWDVYRKTKELKLSLPPVDPPPEVVRVKMVPWYDRTRRILLGDWQDCTISHEHARREIFDPCHHDGPCSAANKCPCVLGKLLCERFCQCTAETCAYKFTGCACHSSGKTCRQRQKEGKPCICVQLNRECDPVLCKGCGASERADPLNALDEALHSTGCQNVPLQRGVSKAVVTGKSQLEGCGYGLFAAEEIAQDEFVIEYTGELITHDEGVRREARRGDVFDEGSSSSYLFTLLEQEGIWVDAAIYGNLSRYINHASEGDKRGCNVMPKILYVNGEFRIRFTALRDIKIGEELFFNYGENFPNLTKKLLEDKEAEESAETGPAPKRKPGRPPRDENARGVARKTTKVRAKDADHDSPSKTGRNRGSKKYVSEGYDTETGQVADAMGSPSHTHPTKHTSRRGGARPGAGRKPKRLKPMPEAADRAAHEEDSNEQPLTRGASVASWASIAEQQPPPQPTAPTAETRDAGAGGVAAKGTQGRKRKAGEMGSDSDNDEVDGDGDDDDSFVMQLDDYGQGGDEDDSADYEEDDDEDDDDGADRVRRKRQKPWRYRVEGD